ncbi:MAG: type II secretion system protein M [Proteobacteria bacterium]|nr:type II secretion system protein M [Pseudomonadota bacterium]
MQAQPADRDRWLALGLLLAALAVAYAVLVHPWWTVPMRAENQRIDALQQRELRLRMQLQQAPAVSERLEQLRQQQTSGPGFLPEANAQLATAALIQRLETVVQQASPGNRSCAITNRSPLQPSTRQRYTRITVQVRMRCGNPELAAVLHSLESGTPRLFVDNLNILAQRMYFSPGVGAPTGDGGLEVTFDLYGYLRPSVEVTRAD